MARLLAAPLLAIIWLYQMTLSPLMVAAFGQQCRFHPSCSQYAAEALQRYGAFRGSWMAAARLLRCHPWHPGGYDPVP